MSAVFDRYPVGGGEMLLALALADVSRDDGHLMINDSVAELARKTRQTPRGVQMQLGRMRATGWLLVVQASDGGRGRTATYRISKAWIDGAALPAVVMPGTDAPDEARSGEPRNPEPCSGLSEPETLNGATSNPERRSGFGETETLNGEAQNPERGSGVIKTNKTKEINSPQPPKGANDLSGEDAEPSGKVPLTLRAWLAECKAKGEQPIPPADPVFAYCDTVGIDRELLALHWREFKARRSESRKRQRDWRATFRNSVRDNWFKLWFLRPGCEAQLTTQGLQAQAVLRAEQAAAAAEAAEREAVPA